MTLLMGTRAEAGPPLFALPAPGEDVGSAVAEPPLSDGNPVGARATKGFKAPAWASNDPRLAACVLDRLG